MKKCLVAGVLIMNESGTKVLLVKHRKLNVWIYPGGHIEENENPLECALREAKEETGASFDILPTSDFTVSAEMVKSLPLPLVIMNEIVPYSDSPHEHFDMIYLGVAKSMDVVCNEESSDCAWFGMKEVQDIQTFDNVKKIVRYGFDTFGRIRERTS